MSVTKSLEYAWKIHSILGKGFKEIVYKDAIILPRKFDADFFVFNSIILEVKAASELRTDNFKQTLNYLKASEVKLGIVINFGEDKLKFKRVICSF